MIFTHFQFYDNDPQYLVLVADTTEFTRYGEMCQVYKITNIKYLSFSLYSISKQI